MPIYEYECTECGHSEEVLQKFSDPPVTECSKCHGAMKKLMSMNSFHLKGSGWYVTDYTSKSKASTTPTAPSGSDAPKKAKDDGASSTTTGTAGKTSSE